MFNLQAAVPLQADGAPLAKEGLPYWAFWLLIWVILLLVTIIFLRDKDLRRRINAFFFGARRRLERIQTKMKIKKEKKKKLALFKELGRKTWKAGIRAEGDSDLRIRLDDLENGRKKTKEELRKTADELESLQESLERIKKKARADVEGKSSARRTEEKKKTDFLEQEEALKKDIEKLNDSAAAAEKSLRAVEREAETLSGEVSPSDRDRKSRKEALAMQAEKLRKERESCLQKISGLRTKLDGLAGEEKDAQVHIEEFSKAIETLEMEAGEKSRRLESEIKTVELKRKEFNRRLDEIEGRKEPLFEDLGRLLNEKRVAHPDLDSLYAQIDKAREILRELQEHLEDLQDKRYPHA